MSKSTPKPAPAITLHIFGEKGRIESRKVKAWYGAAPKNSKTMPRKRRKSA